MGKVIHNSEWLFGVFYNYSGILMITIKPHYFIIYSENFSSPQHSFSFWNKFTGFLLISPYLAMGSCQFWLREELVSGSSVCCFAFPWRGRLFRCGGRICYCWLLKTRIYSITSPFPPIIFLFWMLTFSRVCNWHYA